MKTPFKISLILAGFLMLPSNLLFAASETFSTGQDWNERMSTKEKIISLIPPTLLFRHYGVPLRYLANDYIQEIDELLALNPQYLKEDVSNIFASTVYANEPEARPALESMERDLRLRKAGYNPNYYPRLVFPGRQKD